MTLVRSTKRFNKILVGALCLGSVVSTLVGCSSAPADDAKSLTVLDYFVAEPGHTTYDNLLKKCGASIGVSIDHQSVPATQ